MNVKIIGLVGACLLVGCEQSASPWHLMLSHTRDGVVEQGSADNIVSAVRQGCQLRIAWGARRAADISRTIEHIAEPDWVSIRDGKDINVQIGGFVINHAVLGEPASEHPRRERFGGTEKVVKWRASLKPDGTFDAVWFTPHDGEFITRVPQRHAMKWYADCEAKIVAPLFPTVKEPS